MTYSRAAAVLCFIMVTLITALPPIGWKHPPLSSGADA